MIGLAEKMKVCSRCGEEFPATPEFFHRYTAAKDGLAARCKRCVGESRYWRKIRHGWKPPEIEPDLSGEKWLPVMDCENRYAVSNLGRIKRIKAGRGTFAGRILKQTTHSKTGYSYIALTFPGGQRKNFRSHCLIAKTFLGSRPKGTEVNHKDGDKTNNCVDNLEYITRNENIKHALMTGLYNNRGENHPRHILTEDDIHQIRELIAEGKLTQRKIASMFGVSPTTITQIKTGFIWGWLK